MEISELANLKELALKTAPFSGIEADQSNRQEYFDLVKINDKFFMEARRLVPEMVDELQRLNSKLLELEAEIEELSRRIYDDTGVIV